MRFTHVIVVLSIVLASLLTETFADEALAPEFQKSFKDNVEVFLDSYCTSCHSGDEPEAGMPLDDFERLIQVNQHREVWLHVAAKVNAGEMPPEEELQPSKDEKAQFLKIINGELDKFDCTKHTKPGRVTIRRLNRQEYNNTIRDLLGLDFQPAKNFPNDTVGAGFDNLGDVLSLPPLLMEKYLDAAEEISQRVMESEASRRMILISEPNEEQSETQTAELILEPMAARAFRRPLRDGELDRLIDLIKIGQQARPDFEGSIGFALQAVLISPHFLFRIEFTDGDDVSAARPLTDFELATRLSYFLWSSMPDEELFELARRKQLTDDRETLTQQVDRMMKDEKAAAFVDNFAGQWLELRNLAKLNPAEEVYPEFDDELREAMAEETKLLFSSVMREDRSLLEFVDCDYTFLNERLAKHYGIEGINGVEFQRVSLQDSRRGGILTHASILTLTSNPTRTSPVKRGKWILDNMLGEPPPPPPPGVEELNDGDDELLGTLRERMQQHRDNPSCAVCHKKMDALGFGFENFDGIGKWREQDGGSDIDPSGELPGKLGFMGPSELRRILKTSKRQDFVKCLTNKMLTYALGRELSPDDRCTTDIIVKELEKHDYRFSVLVRSIVASDAFTIRGALEGRKND